MAGSREVKITIVGDASSVSKAFHDASTASDGLDKSIGTVVKTAAGFVLGNAVQKAPGFLLDAAKAAAADEQSMNRLKQAVTNADGSYDTYGKTVDDAIKRGQDLAFSDDETRNALTTLISETGSTEEGMKRLAAAQDLARGANIPLEQAAKLLGKTSDENTTSLSKLGIKLGENATAQDVLNAVDERYKGQAGTYAESAAGQLAIMQDKAGELQESLGYILLPILAAVTVAMTAIVDAIATHVVPALQSFADTVQPIVGFVGDNLTPIIAGLTAGLLVLAASALPAVIAAATTFVTTTAPELIAQGIAIALAYAPLTLAILAIGATVALVAAAWQGDWGGIQEKTQAVIDFLSPYISTFMGGIQTVFETVWPIVSGIVTTYIGAVRLEIETAITAIQLVWGIAWPAIQLVVEGVMLAISTAVTIGMGIVQVIQTGVQLISDAFTLVFSPIATVVSDTFTTISGLVTSLWGPAVSAITGGVDTAKGYFDTLFVPIQGVVNDVFNTIVGIVDDLWNGASGGVAKIKSGLDTATGYFSGVYDTFVGFGTDIMQGLIDGLTSLWDTFTGWIDKITSKLKIDVPGFSPPYEAGQEQGAAFMQGLIDGIAGLYGTLSGGIDIIGDLLGSTLPPGWVDILNPGATAPDLGSTLPPGWVPILGGGGSTPPATNPWDNLTSNPVQPPAGSTPGAPLPAPWEAGPTAYANQHDNPYGNTAAFNLIGAQQSGALLGQGAGYNPAFGGPVNAYTPGGGHAELAAAIKQAIKDGMREAMSGAMG